jgi:hypothetical protein
VPDNNDFDVAVYGQNKLLWGVADSPFQGRDEVLTLNLPPRRYYVMVTRKFPTEKPDPNGIFQITLHGN